MAFPALRKMDNLPFELINSIALHLNAPSRAALACAYRRYYKIVLPSLYSEVLLDGEPIRKVQTKFPSFLHTITIRPDRSAAVHALHLGLWSIDLDDPRVKPVLLDIQPFEGLVHEQSKFTQEAQRWYKAPESRNMDTFLVRLSYPVSKT
jgi:hypothetical protein